MVCGYCQKPGHNRLRCRDKAQYEYNKATEDVDEIIKAETALAECRKRAEARRDALAKIVHDLKQRPVQKKKSALNSDDDDDCATASS